MLRAKRRFMKERDARELLSELAESSRMSAQAFSIVKQQIEVAEIDGEEIFLIDGKPVFARFRNRLIPALLSAKLMADMPKAIVNMGAVPYVCNGADVMAPGIVRFEGNFNPEDLVVVCDERHNKPIAIAISQYSSEEARSIRQGKILKTLHYVGDRLWNAMKKLS